MAVLWLSRFVPRVAGRRSLSVSREEIRDLRVRDFAEVIIELADGPKIFRRRDADDFLHFISQTFASIWWRNRNRNDELCRRQPSDRTNSCEQARSGGNTVVDQNGDFSGDVQRWQAATVDSFAAQQFLTLAGYDRIDVTRRKAQPAKYVRVQNLRFSRCNCAEAEFFVPWRAEFPQHENIERGMNRIGHFKCDGDTTARNTEH